MKRVGRRGVLARRTGLSWPRKPTIREGCGQKAVSAASVGCVGLQFPRWWLRVPWPSQQVSDELYVGPHLSADLQMGVGAVVQRRIYGNYVNASFRCLFSMQCRAPNSLNRLLQPVEFSMFC